MGVFFGALMGVIVARAIQLQVIQQTRLRGLAQDQYLRRIEIPARRGDIFDRRGVALAQSVDVDSIWIDPSLLPNARDAARELARRLHLDAGELLSRFSKAKRFAWVKRQAKPEEVESVKKLELPGLGIAKEPRRFYPQRELAAHILGFVGAEGQGLEGLELAFNDELSGEATQLRGFRDARGRKLLTQTGIDGALKYGATVTLTVDRQLQYLTEKSLARAVEDAKAIAGMAIILDPKTGELLAVANEPRFNPNTPQSTPRQLMRNRAALDTFEPGSTMKSFVIAAALEEKAIRPEDTFFCENGRWTIGRKTIHDTHPHGWLTPQKILQVSSNICIAKIVQLLGRERWMQYLEGFGFGERSGLALPGEGRGRIPYPRAEIEMANQAFGQGLAATAIQIAAGYGALANGGVLMRPYLVSRVVDPDGTVLLANQPTAVRRVLSPPTASKVVAMLETVVDKEGTAPKAKLDEYRVAGKTGTAQKADPIARGYSEKRIASFVGMAPTEDPRIVVLVVIDEPKTDVYGGLVAAPAFKEIAQAALPYLGVSPAQSPMVVRAMSLPQAMRSARKAPNSGKTGKRATAIEPPAQAVTEQLPAGTVQVPDVQGKSGRKAVSELLAVSLEPQLFGTGRVISQSPSPGVLVNRGTRVIVDMGPRQ
jgi:cell division protein FtsI (penicillin-binding protein 3)